MYIHICMLFYFTPHIYTPGELLKKEGSRTKELAVTLGLESTWAVFLTDVCDQFVTTVFIFIMFTPS